MTMLTAVFFVACTAVGVGLTGYLPVPLRLEERIPIGVVIGTMAVTLLALPAIAVFGFGGMAVMVAVMVAATAAMPARGGIAMSLRTEYVDLRRRHRLGWRRAESPGPLVVLCAVAWPLTVRILSLAYQPGASGGVAAGHLSTFGDWQAHIGYAGAFAEREGLDLESPLAAGERLAYHFGVDLFAALAETTGLSRRDALVVTSGFLAFAMVPILYMFGRHLFRRRSVAVGGAVGFLMAGGWGFTKFFSDVADAGRGSVVSDLTHVFWNQPRDYTRDFETYYMDNPVLGHLYPQRPTLIGFSVVLIALTVLWAARTNHERDAFLFAGVLVGLTPIFHTFGWGTALVMGAIWAATDHLTGVRHKGWLWFLVPAIGLAVPAVLWLRPPDAGDSFRWQFGWVSDGSLFGFVEFWFLNTGLFAVLFIAALLWRPALSRRLAVALAPIWLWFIGVNLAIPHPWPGNNSKYAIYWWLLGSFAVAALLVTGADYVRDGRNEPVNRVLVGAGAAVSALTLVASGGLDVVAAVDGTTPSYPAQLSSAGQLQLEEWIADSTPGDAVFVSSTSSAATPIGTLAGRTSVSAFDGWVFDLGVNWNERREDSLNLLSGSQDAEQLIDEYGIDYVIIGPTELAAGASIEYWSSAATLVYDLGGYQVYAL